VRIRIDGEVTPQFDIRWNCRLFERYDQQDELEIVFDVYAQGTEVFCDLKRALAATGVQWLVPTPSLGDQWVLDLDVLRLAFVEVANVPWLCGRRLVRPFAYDGSTEIDSAQVHVYIERDVAAEEMDMPAPPELRPFLQQFHLDHPRYDRCCFVMMRYTPSPIHNRVYTAIKSACARLGLEVLRADQKAYSDELLSNIRTYMHGCGFGISIFERITTEDFNPNVSLEVGYMMALGKPVCFLKDKYLPALHTDLVGRLYQPFDPQDPEASLPIVLEMWLRDKGIVR
jgi:hypothetical protein